MDRFLTSLDWLDRTVKTRKQVRSKGEEVAKISDVNWNPRETAVNIVYMWNNHHCVSAARRVIKIDVHFQRNNFNPDEEGPLADHLEKAGCSCDTPDICGPDKRVWPHQIKAAEMADINAVTSNGQEVYNLLQQRGIKNVIIMGVHTNRCVLGRPFGIRQMAYLGENVLLCRDLTDSYHRDPGKHFEGLAKLIRHIETW